MEENYGFCCTLEMPRIDRAKLKTELEEYGRKLRLLLHFRNAEQSFIAYRFRRKSSFNSRSKDIIIDSS